MKRTTLLISFSVLIVLSALFNHKAGADSATLVFKLHGNSFKTATLEKLKQLIPPVKVRVLEPHESQEREYIGFPVSQLLTFVYGDEWKKFDEILFSCRDGYEAAIPTENFSRFISYLVYGSTDKEQFTLINKLQGNEVVDLGPFYIIWDDIKFPEVLKIGSVYWPYQITTIDVINFSERFPRMAPPANSSDAAKSGFYSFRTHCMSCHSINGEGGHKARELNYPVSVIEYIDEPWLRKWINNPRDVSYNSTMPALARNAEDRERTIDNIISYLKVMKNNKRKPES